MGTSLRAARAYATQHLRARGLLPLQLADDPLICATRWSSTATTRSRPRACTTIRSSGDRSAPDLNLAQVGTKYSDDWHVRHLTDPSLIVPQSVMPGYPFLAKTEIDT